MSGRDPSLFMESMLAVNRLSFLDDIYLGSYWLWGFSGRTYAHAEAYSQGRSINLLQPAGPGQKVWRCPRKVCLYQGRLQGISSEYQRSRDRD